MPNKTQNRLAAIAFRWSITAVFILRVFAASAPAQRVQPAAPTSITGVYNGTYTGDQGPIKFKLSVTQQDNGTLAGSYTIYLPDGSDTKSYTCDVKGRYIAPNRMITLIRGKWETAPPAGVDMLGMTGVFDPAGTSGAGQISGRLRGRPGPQFQAIRDADESAKFASATPAKDAAAAAPAPVDAPPMRQPVAAGTDVTRAPVAPAPATPTATGPAAINGVYTGEFKRGNDTMKLKFAIKATDDGSLTALYTLDPPANRRGSSVTHKGSSVTYKLTGKYVPGAKEYGVGSSPFQFTAIEPVGSAVQEALAASKVRAVHVGITGPGTINGSMTGSNPGSGEFIDGWISAKRDNAESADLDKAMLAQGSGVATAVPVAPVVHPAYEGVYNGAATDKDGTNRFKLTLWLDREGRTADGRLVSTQLAGLLTVFATDSFGTMPYTTEVKGTFNGARGTFALTRSGRYDPPPSGVSIANGVRAKFDPGSGGSAPRITGDFDQPSGPKIEATRDAAESASMNFDRLRNHIYPGTVGVFNGTYTRENEPPTKFKLTVHHNGQTAEIVAVATIYLPADSGTKAYSYDLIGLAIDHGHFELRVHDWVTPPPADFKNFKAMGFYGKMALNEALTSATIANTPPAPSMAEFYMPHFEATWDATESSDINGTLAAQKAIGSAEQVAALKARDQMLTTVPPKQLASKDLVRKSKAYWDGYQTDMVREVFDGGFGAAMDENKLFQEVFCTYVEMFSAKFPDSLPANHVRVTNTVRTNRKFDQNGILQSEEVHDYTVDMDPRFVDGYKRCYIALNSKGAELRNVIAAAQPGGAQRVINGLLDVATDMRKFFADHGGKSAATRQLNENFLRAINGDPSLQQADGKIDGAQAESDKDLPPGRYARFVDGANAFFRERARANPVKFGSSSSHDTALCQRLAELYEFKMTREEEYYYANDFGVRFLPIMGIRSSCPDPAWPQLHPLVEQCLAEIR